MIESNTKTLAIRRIMVNPYSFCTVPLMRLNTTAVIISGPNIVCTSEYGPGFTVETGKRQDFHARLQIHKTVVKTAVKVFEDRYA